jgi:hypothetical protein
MNCKTARLFVAALLALGLAGVSQAGTLPFCYNIDADTVPGGPIELESPAATNLTAIAGGYQVTMSGDAYNDSATQTFDVLFLNQFNFSISSGAAFTFNSGAWSGIGGDTLQLADPSGFLPMTDTDAPLSFTQDSVVAMLAAGDSPPYVSIGAIGPEQSVPFSFTVDMSTEAPFNLYGSFVSPTPIPEPSSLALTGLAAIALCAAARRRRAGK